MRLKIVGTHIVGYEEKLTKLRLLEDLIEEFNMHKQAGAEIMMIEGEIKTSGRISQLDIITISRIQIINKEIPKMYIIDMNITFKIQQYFHN